MKTFVNLMIAVAMAATLSAPAITPAEAAGGKGCLTDRQVQAAISAGQIKSWPAVKSLADLPPGTEEVSDVKVCLVQGVPFYQVNVVSPNGEAKKVTLNAIDGSR